MKRLFLFLLAPLLFVSVGFAGYGCPTFGESILLSLQGEDLYFLGDINEGENGIGNYFGSYGSPYGEYSIFNSSLDIGSDYFDVSPRKEDATNPPYIYNFDEGVVGRMTTNSSFENGVDPLSLIACSMDLSYLNTFNIDRFGKIASDDRYEYMYLDK